MKKLIVLGFACALAGFASASEIYWQVNSVDLAKASQDYNWKIARLVATTGTDVTKGGDILSGIGREDLEAGLAGSFEIADKYKSGYNFYVELVNSNGLYDKYTGVAAVGTISYSDLQAGAYEGGMGMPGTPYSFSGDFVATPEPTTGMLFVLGMMALGLKRKKEIV